MKRIMIRLPDPAHAALQQRAAQTGEPLASTAANLLRTMLEDGEEATQRRARLRTRPTPSPRASGVSAPWIAPDDDSDWHQNTWGMILALHERYPRALAKLEHDWYEHHERAETLAALATWRASIDAGAEDPREELASQNALQQLARVLDQAPGLGRAFKPGTAMPTGWDGA